MHYYALADVAGRKIVETVGPVATFPNVGAVRKDGLVWLQVTDNYSADPVGSDVPEFEIGINCGVIRHTNR